MNFGKWIFVSFVLFALFIATLVTICVREDISLVSKDYYNEELAYQQQIQRINNTASLTVKPVISIQDDSLKIILPDAIFIEQGILTLFCPSNSKMDRLFQLQKTSVSQHFALTGLQPGMYRAKLSWTMNGKDYYQEEIVNL